MSVYDETLTAEETALIEAHDRDTTLPPAEDADQSPSPAEVAAEQGQPVAPAAPAPAAPAPAGEAAPAAGQTEDEKFAAFMAQNAGKSPEELARLAFQQSQRAAQAGFSARQAREALEARQTQTQAALEQIRARREALANQRSGFADQLAADPDAATRALHERVLSDDERRLEAEELSVRRAAMLNVAASAIPEFEATAPRIHAFGAELNYSPEELGAMTDPRDMVTLWLASLSGQLMKSGVMDLRGNLVAPQPAVTTTDPRLTVPPALQTLGSTPARAGAPATSVEKQLTDILNMSDADLAAFEKANPGMLDNLLRQAG